MGKIDVQSYRAHTEVLSFLILLKFRTDCGSVEDWGKKNIKKFQTFKQHKTKKGRCFSVLSVFCAASSHLFFFSFSCSGLKGGRRLLYPSHMDN